MGDEMKYYTGQNYVGQTFTEATTFENCDFTAPCILPAGCRFINCTFHPLRTCGFFGSSACPVRSQVAGWSLMTGGLAEYVDFASTAEWQGVTQGDEVTPPSCVDCAGQSSGQAVSATTACLTIGGPAALTKTPGEFCAAQNDCGTKGNTVVVGSGVQAVTGKGGSVSQ